MIGEMVLGAVAFGRHAVGVAVRPYETYRRIAAKGTVAEFAYLTTLLILYFAAASLVMTTREFVTFFPSALGGYLMTLAVFWLMGTALGGTGKLLNVALAWGYTLLPTLIWFSATSVLYVVLPPPRTLHPAGIAFSLVYLVFSTVLLAWKLTLGYLTLRFGLKLDLPRIAAVGIVAVVAWSVYSISMYRLGIFRIPFL